MFYKSSYKIQNYFLSIFIILTLSCLLILDRYDILYLLNPSYYAWHEQYGSSLGQHLSGWYSYYYEEWRFPLTITKGINHPNFNSIILSDSIPILAVFFKFLKPIMNENFHYFGIWQILCIILLFHSCYLLCKKKISESNYICILFCILCASSYLLFSRNPNYTTIGHFLIYYALYLYLELRESITTKKIIFSSILLISSLLIMFYFYAMVFVLLLCGYLQGLKNGNYHTKFKIGLSAYFTILILLIGYIFGFFYNLSGLNYIRITSTGMPLLSLFFGSNELNINTLLGNELDVMGDNNQYESLNYLGLGMILLILISLNKINLVFIKKNIYLFFFFVSIFFYSLGSRIYFFDELIFSYNHNKIPFLDFVAGKLAVVGRLFIFNYIILTYVFFKFLILKKNKYKMIIVSIIVFLQFYDVYYLNFSEGRLKNNFLNLTSKDIKSKYKLTKSDKYQYYDYLLSEIQTNIIYVVPPYNCKGSSDGAVLYAKIVREKKFTNNIWFGRDNHPCPKKINEVIEAMRKSKGEIEFIFIDHLLNEDRFVSINESKDNYLTCRDVKNLENIDHCRVK